MTATAVEKKANSTSIIGHKTTRYAKSISWTDFQKKYLIREDGFKYEWVDGEVVKSKNMDFTQLYIVKNLLAFFRSIVTQKGVTGELLPESDIFFGAKHRRPDISYLTDQQIVRTSYGENQVPQLVIEIISNSDQANLIQLKMKNYRDAGVLVVWHIFPATEQVHVYSGSHLKNMVVCEKEDICTATPVLPEFEIPVNAVFKKFPKP